LCQGRCGVLASYAWTWESIMAIGEAPLCSAVSWYGNLWRPPAVMLWTHPWAVRLRRARMVVPLGATMHHKGARPMAREMSVHGIDSATCHHEPKCSFSPGLGPLQHAQTARVR